MAHARQEHWLDRALQTPVSRRSLLKAASGAGLLAATGATLEFGNQRIAKPLLEQRNTWDTVLGSREDFFERYQHKFSRMKLGANISPDFRLFTHNADPARVMAFLAGDLGCTDLRFGVRWNSFQRQGLAPYVPYYKEAEKNGIAINTCIPSPKNPWWPEEHIPPEFEAYIPQDRMVRAGSQFGNIVLETAKNFFNELERYNIDPQSLDYCPVNECVDAHGRYGLRMEEDFMAQYAELLSHRAPGRKFLMNASCFAMDTTSPLRICTNYAMKFKEQFPAMQYVVGVDFYHQSEFHGVDSTIDTASAAAIRYGPNHIASVLSDIAAHEIEFENTEAQKHLWGDAQLPYPPGTEEHFRYILARFANKFVDRVPGLMVNKPYISRVWGLEEDIVAMVQDPGYIATKPVYSLIRDFNQIHAT